MSKRVVPAMPASQKAQLAKQRRSSMQARERLHTAADRQTKALGAESRKRKADRRASTGNKPKFTSDSTATKMAAAMGGGQTRWKDGTFESKVIGAIVRFKGKLLGRRQQADADRENLNKRLQGRAAYAPGAYGTANRRMSALSKRAAEERQLQKDMGRTCCVVS
jgi:hypothetical protein